MSLKWNRLLKPTSAETVNTVSLLVTVCDIAAAVISVFSAVLPECSSCPLSGSVVSLALWKREVIAKSYPIRPVIQLSTDFRQQKKPVHPDGMYRPKIVRLLPCLWRRVITSKCNRLCNSKSKLSFTLVCCWQFIVIQKRRCFRLAHRSVVRLQVVLSKSVINICIQLLLSCENILLSFKEQVFANTSVNIFSAGGNTNSFV